ncbi:LPS export ABC transporter permease LptF [Pontibaca methylaminivorans]|uniref:Lipopolysaccharide export system permease protein n=1 Tax=Pontibaca methylaminivorans TaxID=515897 RepID=A0A1R3X301_9RHOB|nr:LPS export ABC transporter permease LptF [Pontibaca methylaminivorans]SIT83708.1 lipopolysaccharide export system permease protein [Pontibaca methylaminivorans]
MSRYDRYVLSRLLLFFGFFALILVAVFWINRAVVLFDRLIGDGQSLLVFLEFSALALPNLIRMILPMAVFAAAVYVTNRMQGDSEITVMQATGTSPWRLARPPLVFGLLAALMMSVLTHLLLPASISQLSAREAEVAQSISARLLSEGTFLHPVAGVTFYIGRIDPDSTLNDIFLSDRRDSDQSVTYTAERAYLLRDGERANLVMVNGMAQLQDNHEHTLSTTRFSDFSYDISALLPSREPGARSLREVPTIELLTRGSDIARDEGFNPGKLAEELHLRFARALICVAVALIGFSTLMLGGFSRFGVWRQALLAFVLVILLEVLRGLVSGPVLADARLWPLVYLPTFAGLAVAALFLQIAARPPALRLRRQTRVRETAA